MNFGPAVLYYACAALWLFMGVRDGNVLDYACAIVWLAGGIVHTIRYLKKKKEKDEE